METPPKEDSPLKSKVLVIVVALVLAIAAQVFDRILLHEGIPRYDLLAVSNLLTGTVAGAFFWQAMRRDRDRRKFIRERLHTISEMNHHIRNALQVISLHSYREHDEKSVAQLQQAVNRVEWALDEILPGELPAGLVPDLSRGHSQSETANP